MSCKGFASERIRHRNVFARVVPRQGVDAYAVKQLSNEISLVGHSEIVLKSDGEPSIDALKKAVKDERSERIMLESSPVKESKSNGSIENGIQQVRPNQNPQRCTGGPFGPAPNRHIANNSLAANSRRQDHQSPQYWP